MLNSVVDGKQVNIPVLFFCFIKNDEEGYVIQFLVIGLIFQSFERY